MVAVLCAARNSIYKELDCDVYDATRNALTFPCDQAVIAHPPCRAWSAFCRHQAQPDPGERALGVWCCEVLKECGGVLEQPAHSRLFDYARLPLPGESDGVLWSIAVQQAWWGFPFKKGTWLCFSRVQRELVNVPFVLRNPSGDRERWNTMSKNQRAATCRAFAVWLLDVAGKAD